MPDNTISGKSQHHNYGNDDSSTQSSKSTGDKNPQRTPAQEGASRFPDLAPAAARLGAAAVAVGVTAARARRGPQALAALATQTRSISYGAGVQPGFNTLRQQSPTLDRTVRTLQQHEDEARAEVDGKVPPGHDFEKYADKFHEGRQFHVELNRGKQPHYDQRTRTVSLMDLSPDTAAHETTHAEDSITGLLTRREDRLASEQHALSRQQRAYQEASGTTDSPPMFENRSVRKMTEEVYQGKKSYPGTLQSSVQGIQSRISNTHVDAHIAGQVGKILFGDGTKAPRYTEGQTLESYVLSAAGCRDRSELTKSPELLRLLNRNEALTDERLRGSDSK
ncbi:hypothetical protein N0A02_27390 [Paraburkholderia acidicola]|uniref:Uncharacterized protein n=1 Tax=Paraburkholderia acidicola TaxID=1912599 RepID=A0ABV1LVC0_9BURK